MSNAVPGASTLPLTSRHRPDAELTRTAADVCADHAGAVVSNMVSSAITTAGAPAAGRRRPRAAGPRVETDEGCILFLAYVGEGDRECLACSKGAKARESTPGTPQTSHVDSDYIRLSQSQ